MARPKFELPPPPKALDVACRACGQTRPLEEYRVYRVTPLLRMDFCVHCEAREGTVNLYRRFNAYGTKEVVEAVFAANRAPAARRTPDQARLLVEPKTVRAPETNAEVLEREIARREMSRRRLLYYVLQMMPAYTPGWVHQDICRRLEKFMRDIEAQKSPRLILAMPPRAGKSTLVSDMFPSWLLGHHPEWEITVASYAQELPIGFSRNIRDRLADPAYQAIFPNTKIRADAKGVEAWRTTKSGGVKAVGVGVGLTGHGAHVAICFVAGTRVMTDNGAVPIEAIVHAPGKYRVLTHDTATGSRQWRKVLGTSINSSADLVRVTTAQGRSFACTADHPVYTSDGGYIAAGLLAEGAPLVTGGVFPMLRTDVQDVDAMRAMPQSAPQSDQDAVSLVEKICGASALVYDIEVEGEHNFFAEGILVHNCDDLIKDAEAASSDVIRENTWQWYQTVLRTRLAPGGGVLICATRWHWHDPTGRALEIDAEMAKAGVPDYERENWEIVSYPAIAEHDEYLMPDGRIEHDAEPSQALRLLRHKGEALQPERYPLNELQKVKNVLTTGNWSALYQQNPTPEEGDYFRKDDFRQRWLDPAYRRFCRVFMTVDYAIGKKERNDFTVAGVFALDANDDLYVLEIRRGRWGTLQIAQNIADMVEAHGVELYAGEQGQLHHAVWPIVERELAARRKYVSVDETLVPIQDKETRARPLQGRMQRHKLFFSYDERTRPEIYDIAEREMLQFPNGVNDDIVDMLAWGARLALNVSLPYTKPMGRQNKSWKDELNEELRGSRSFMAA